jgi:multidrug efflux pump subunit AcrA (membrane-fusion protein)
MDELMELVEGSAMLVTSGKQAARWWYPSNVFGPKTVERWIADVGELQAAQAGAEERQAELRAIEARTEKERQEAAKAPKAKVQDLGLARVYADLLQTVREKQNNVVASQHDEADKPVSAS